jgi:hypothetical protein
MEPHNPRGNKRVIVHLSFGDAQMGTLEDVRNWLKEIPLWRELGTIPDRTAVLEKRVEELESKLGGKWPADICRHCGERAARLEYSRVETNGVEVTRWDCEKCQFSDFRSSKTG